MKINWGLWDFWVIDEGDCKEINCEKTPGTPNVPIVRIKESNMIGEIINSPNLMVRWLANGSVAGCLPLQY